MQGVLDLIRYSLTILILQRKGNDHVLIFPGDQKEGLIILGGFEFEFKTDMVGESASRRYDIYLYSVLPCNIAEFLGLRRVEKLDVAIIGVALLRFLFKMDEKRDREKNDEECQNRGYVKSDSNGKTDASGRPKARRGGKSRDLRAVADYDRSDTEESDARNDLCADSERVGGEAENSDLVNARHRRNSRADADKNVCSQSRRATVVSALHSNASADKQSQQDSDGNADQIKFCQGFNNIFQEFQSSQSG